jgi:hypothetical protein
MCTRDLADGSGDLSCYRPTKTNMLDFGELSRPVEAPEPNETVWRQVDVQPEIIQREPQHDVCRYRSSITFVLDLSPIST